MIVVSEVSTTSPVQRRGTQLMADDATQQSEDSPVFRYGHGKRTNDPDKNDNKL